jgi:D-alanine-D-alanine ligase
LHIALVYNQKKEETKHQSSGDDSSEPPSSRGDATEVLVSRTPTTPLVKPSQDLYAEWDTFETIDAVRAALAEFHDVTLVEADEQAYNRLLDERPDMAFNIAEGLHGVSREAQMPAIFETLQIPYTGSDPLTLASCLDKSRAKEILSYHHVPTPRFWVASVLADLRNTGICFPCMAKPLHEGSSKGIFNASLVTNERELHHQVNQIIESYHEPAIIEEYLPGREFTVAMLGNGANATVLPIVEIKFDSLPAGVNPIYSYEAKWVWDTAENPLDIFECPANISATLRNEIETLCRKTYFLLRCRDWSRIDVRLDSTGRAHIIEVNPLPGILPNPEDNSCFPKAARAAGMGYNQLMQTVVAIAANRYHLHGHLASLHPTN